MLVKRIVGRSLVKPLCSLCKSVLLAEKMLVKRIDTRSLVKSCSLCQSVLFAE